MRHSVLAIVALTLAAAVAGDPVPKEKAEARAALWVALKKAMPKDLVIDAYEENPSLTVVCFSANRQVYLFRLKGGNVEEKVSMKWLPKINRITFRPSAGPGKDPDDGDFVLWANGEVEMSFFCPR